MSSQVNDEILKWLSDEKNKEDEEGWDYSILAIAGLGVVVVVLIVIWAFMSYKGKEEKKKEGEGKIGVSSYLIKDANGQTVQTPILPPELNINH